MVGWVFGLDFGDGRGFLGSSTAAAMVAGLAGSDGSDNDGDCETLEFLTNSN